MQLRRASGELAVLQQCYLICVCVCVFPERLSDQSCSQHRLKDPDLIHDRDLHPDRAMGSEN